MFNSVDELTINILKGYDPRLYYYGLGFIQLKLNETYRLHFYSENLPPIVDHPHNHRYDFTSTILKGTIQNKIFKEIDGDDWLLTKESCQEEVKSPSDSRLCGLELVSDQAYMQSESYRMNYKDLHQVKANNCITLLRRGEYKQNFADVSRPVKGQSICPFSQKIEEPILWDIIGRMIND